MSAGARLREGGGGCCRRRGLWERERAAGGGLRGRSVRGGMAPALLQPRPSEKRQFGTPARLQVAFPPGAGAQLGFLRWRGPGEGWDPPSTIL